MPSGAMDRGSPGNAIAAIERRPIGAAVSIAIWSNTISWRAVPIAAIAVSRIAVAIGRARIAIARIQAIADTSSARVTRRSAVCPSVNPSIDPGNARRG